MGLFVCLLARATWGVFERWQVARREEIFEQSNYNATTERAAKLGSDLESIKTERGWEGAVRENFQVAKPGEGLIVLVGTST